ncbi:SMI1/KNR4 family protein [Pararhizobium arenae]|uniref:SMI1/KNR4 family protein n=1 Tax=Pararhizobium arenae TaxID=1856850 RepID=UPI00094AA265|nr:SMI1/KNR4 family protein [Pararhizobium arenae]
MNGHISRLADLDRRNQLASLEPVSDDTMQAIAKSYPGISGQYLEFIRKFGTGSTTLGFYIYEPEPARSVEKHISFQLYQSEAYSNLFGQRPPGDIIPDDAIMIADSGATWRYCLCPSRGDAVFCLDMSGPRFEVEAEDFFSFVEGILESD